MEKLSRSLRDNGAKHLIDKPITAVTHFAILLHSIQFSEL